MRTLLLAALLAACLAHVAESAAPRRPLTFDIFPAGLRSDSGKCWESLLTLGLCKHDLLASFFTGCPVPGACCRAADEVDVHCGPFTRAFVGSLLPRGLLLQCAASTGRPSVRALPPRAPADARTSPIASGAGGARAPPGAPEAHKNVRFPTPPAPKVSSGTHAPPGPEAYTSVRFPPPRTPKVLSSATHAPAEPKARTITYFPPRAPYPPRVSGSTHSPPRAFTSVYLPPPYPPRASRGTHAPPPKVASGTHAPVGSGAHDDVVRGGPAVPVYGGAGGSKAPRSKVVGRGSAPVKVAAAPPRGSRTASPSTKSLPHGTPF